MKRAVIDVSSSSLSLIVAEVRGKRAEIVFKDRMSLCLLQYTEEGTLTDRGREKLISGLIAMKGKCRALGVQTVYLIATAALRRAKNCEEVKEEVREQTGLLMDLIDAETEGYCDLVANRYYASCDRAVLIDIGGGSVEVCGFGKEGKLFCFGFGTVTLHNRFVKKIQPDEDEAREIRKYVKSQFEREGLPGKGVYDTAVLVGATTNALYDIYRDFTGAEEEDGENVIRYQKFKKLVRRLLSGADRSNLVLNNAPEKLYVIGVTAVVLKALFKRLDVQRILISDKGVKEGYLTLVLKKEISGNPYNLSEEFEPENKEEKQKSELVQKQKACGKRRGRPKKSAAEPDKGAEKTTASEAVAEQGAEKKTAGRTRKSSAAKTSAARTGRSRIRSEVRNRQADLPAGSEDVAEAEEASEKKQEVRGEPEEK